jgi:DNA-binding Lrp family transcriptional regulator
VEETLALVLIKAELGTAKQVAEKIAALDAVEWTVVVTGQVDVIAAVKVADNAALGTLIVDQLQQIAGVQDPSTLVVTESFYGGFAVRGNEGFP